MIEEARAAGATIGREPGETFWGGYSAVFIDPDGYPWEVAHNPRWTIERGRLGDAALRTDCENPAPVAGFRPVDPKQSFPELEERILERWRERDVFQRSFTNREGSAALELLRGPAHGQRPTRAPITSSPGSSRTSIRASRP